MFAFNLSNFLFFITFVQSVYSQGYDINQLCTDVSNKDACNNVERDQAFECAENVNSMIDCVLNINNGKRQFAILQPEQALLAANFMPKNLKVIGEIIEEKPPFQTVVIAGKYNSLEDLRNKRFCHPGFNHDELVSSYILHEFEAKIIELNSSYCISDAETLLEKQLGALSSFFGPTCRPGEWAVDDPALDAALKKKYSNLCDLCGPEKCNVNYQEPFQDALTCLSRDGGDVAVTSLSHALKFFNDSSNIDNFVYVCSDGKPKNPRYGNCTFTDQMNRIIISDQSIVDATRNYLEKNYPSNKSPPNGFVMQSYDLMPLKDALDVLLALSKTDNIKLINPVPLKEYVSRHRKIPSLSNNTYCEETVKWCTINEKEQEKCLWMQQAALNAGLQPVIQCVQTEYNERISCINDIKNGKSDVAFIDVNYGYRALKSGLTYVAFPETYNKDFSTIVIAVSNDSTINNLEGKKACIPQYEGKEWLAFIDTLKSNKVMSNKSCDYNENFEEFVGDSCVPGAKNKYFDAKNPEKLCAQCERITNVFKTSKTCNNDHENKYYKADGALKCLEDKAGDYAVVTLSEIVKYRNKTDNFKVICRNGSIAKNAGLSVDFDCALTIITTGGIVVKNNTLKRSNIIQLLKGIDFEFGQSLRKTFKVFERFDDVPDLLFPDSTIGLLFDDDELGKPVENFKNLLGNVEKCVADPNVTNPNIVQYLVPSIVIIILVIIILVIIIVALIVLYKFNKPFQEFISRCNSTRPKRDGLQLDGTQPDGTQPDGTQPDGTQPDGTQPESLPE